jgi:adenosine deaminase
LDALRAERLGHGIRCLEDADLVAEIRELRIALEVCPTSNVMTGVIASIEKHPLPALLDAGLVVTLNSDDPSMFHAPITSQFELARDVFHLPDERLADLSRAAVHASFAAGPTKSGLLGAIESWLGRGP